MGCGEYENQPQKVKFGVRLPSSAEEAGQARKGHLAAGLSRVRPGVEWLNWEGWRVAGGFNTLERPSAVSSAAPAVQVS